MGSPVVAVSPRKSPTSGRRTNKPLVEKKRRARINGCLTQLKSLILSAMQTEGAQVSRLEKADILEMTVKYLRHMQRQQINGTVSSEPEVVAKFSAGYSECASEVIRYIDSAQCVTPDIKSRLESHLVERLRGSVPTTDISPVSSPLSSESATVPTTAHSHNTAFPTHTSNNVSSTTSVDESSNDYFPAYEMARHYQTAVDLANMASAVTAKEAVTPKSSVTGERQKITKTITASSNSQNAFAVKPSVSEDSALVRSQSTSPRNHRLGEHSVMTSSIHEDDARRRHNSSEPAMPCSLSSLSPFPCPTYSSSVQESSRISEQPHIAHNIPSSTHGISNSYPTDRYHTPVTMNDINNNSNNNRNLNEYLRTFQRPLHIDIPGSPVPAPTPSPPFLHPHLAYNNNPHPQSHTLNSSPSPFSSTPTHTVEDAPPTILYGYNGECDSGFHTGSVNCLPNNENTNPHPAYRCNNNRYSRNDTGYRHAPYPLQEPHGQNTLAQQRGSAVETLEYARAIAQSPSNSNPHHHQQQKMPATPSPPTLIREEPYSTQMNHKVTPDTVSYHHTMNIENQIPSVCHKTVANSYSNLTNNNNGPDYTTVYQGPHQSKFLRPYRQDHYDLRHPHPDDVNHQSSAIGIRENPVGQTAHTKPFNNQQTINGAKSCPRVLSRQDAAPLSPPALKKRLLFGQGSEGERKAQRFNGVHPVKTRNLHEVVEQSEIRLYHEESWRKADESTQKRFIRIPNVSEPAVMACDAPAHSVSPDDGLWRPW